ncbi:MAG: hypothetical protein J6Y13_08870 [Treponema sp.]|nr:hypothetical protein [Treponema sp.]
MGMTLKTMGVAIGGLVAGLIIFALNKENLELVDDCNKLRDDYNKLVDEWNEKIAKKSTSPNPHWKHFNNPHAKPQAAVVRVQDAVDEDGTRHKAYLDLNSGTSFTVLGG